MNTIQISIEANDAQQEILVSQLSDLGAEGFEQTPTHLLAYFNEINFNSYDVNLVLEGFACNTATLAETNWNAVWESNFQPVVVRDFCGIRAAFHEPIPGVQHEIIITPKMSFGTGHHATTSMMIQHMQHLDLAGKKVFDFGTGTGILAILAEKLGAASLTAIDIEEWSIRNARENADINSCNRISLKQTTSIPDEQFDIILANINRNVILDYLPQLNDRLVPGGKILVSGLLTTDQKDIVAAFQAIGMQLLQQTERSNWISLLFIK